VDLHIHFPIRLHGVVKHREKAIKIISETGCSEDFPFKYSGMELQNTAILGTANIVRKILMRHLAESQIYFSGRNR
jgi:hypothetical protein